MAEWTVEAALAHVHKLKGEALAGDDAALKELRGLLDEQSFPDVGKEGAAKAVDELGAGPVDEQTA